MSANEEVDLYEVLSITRGASKAEIKKAYHKAALSSHPDKVQDDQRADAEVKFKQVSQAYEILGDDKSRSMYDQYGMSAFEKGSNGFQGGAGPDLDDILAQMFGASMGGDPFGGMGGGTGAPGGRRKRARGKPELQEYQVTLEELYKGKTTKFASTKNVICAACSGSGGKEKAKLRTCDSCKGRGSTTRTVPVGPGMITQQTVPCSTCSGRGQFYADKDKCKKCKGTRIVKQKKILELYIPRGSREGERIVLAGEADQDPDDEEPGDIIFELVEEHHATFHRAGNDLQAELNVSLSEALTGFNRAVVTHLDGRGIRLHVQHPQGKVLRPDQILKVSGEGMPLKRSDQKGDLYLVVKINFPQDGWLKDDAAIKAVRNVLPAPSVTQDGSDDTSEIVDDAEFEVVDDLSAFGAGSDDPRAGAEWEDDDDEGAQAQCAQQ